MNLSTPNQIKGVLQAALGKLEKFERCALLGHPAHPNIGDHLIWLGEVSYLTDVLKADINYAAHIYNFCNEEMKKQIGDGPILLSGGGNLGDLWPHYQEFRERVISHCPERPIIILPQTIYFANRTNLAKAARVFNSHQNLTLFVRDKYSYEIAVEFFHNCQVIQAPDMAFQLVDTPELLEKNNTQRSILYLCRKDKELNQEIFLDSPELINLVIEDWASYNHQDEVKDKQVSGSGNSWNLGRIVRGGWQGGRISPLEWITSKGRTYLHPYVSKFSSLYEPSQQRQSWNLMHDLLGQLSQYRCRYRQFHMQRQSSRYAQVGAQQLSQHQLVITNRLHGHIFCLLLGIPHVFLPNAYYKNEAFYESWTAHIPFCRFVKHSFEVKDAVQELFDLYPSLVAKDSEVLTSNR